MKLDPHERAIVIECVEQMLERLSAYGTAAAAALLRDIFGPNSLERAAMKTGDLPFVPSNAGRADCLLVPAPCFFRPPLRARGTALRALLKHGRKACVRAVAHIADVSARCPT